MPVATIAGSESPSSKFTKDQPLLLKTAGFCDPKLSNVGFLVVETFTKTFLQNGQGKERKRLAREMKKLGPFFCALWET